MEGEHPFNGTFDIEKAAGAREKRLHRDLVGRVQYRWRAAPGPSGFEGEAQAAECARVGFGEVQTAKFGEVDGLDRGSPPMQGG